jgi:peroxiredoxin
MPTIQAGDRMPEVTLYMLSEAGVRPVTTEELFAGKTVVLFSVPGPFTPTCSEQHLPGYIAHIDQFAAKDVDAVACVAVADPFVMDAWGTASGADGKVLMVSDGNGALAEATGTTFDGSAMGLGVRSQRYAMVVRNGLIEHLFLEGGPQLAISGADNVLAHL